ncbi:uncharacterized protein LOC105262415 [Musca domestica]|uniref:Uncharacterized protein LOC105262415 n=1 Tax=Musca domestica TaxID=7370 RepID=A0A9J7DC59_MUSDO|nr:uncharacterized protein LOC105262415 [Musca domestica]
MATANGALRTTITLALLMLTTHSPGIECRPEPKSGFLGGVLGGAVGSMIGKSISDHTSHHKKYQSVPQTTIETRETYSNGCYKQVIKEPNISSPGTFIETEQIICPPNVAPPVVNVMTQPASVPVVGVMPAQTPVTTVYQTNAVASSPAIVSTQPHITVLSKKIGSYGNGGNSLTKTGLFAVIPLVFLIQFM